MSEGKFSNFLITTSVGGVFFLVPVVIFGIVLAKALSLMKAVAEPMAGWLPTDTVGGIALANIIAALVLVILCFLAGLTARHAMASAFVESLETRFLVSIPGYLMLKNLVSGFDESKVAGLKPVALQLGTAERIGYEIEILPDGRSMVFIPSPPNPFSGITQVLPPQQVTYLDVSLKDVMEVTENFGYGSHKILSRKREAKL